MFRGLLDSRSTIVRISRSIPAARFKQYIGLQGYNNTSMDDQELHTASATSAEERNKRLKFGSRFLTDPQNVFQHNAWDNVVWDEEQEAAAKKIALNHVSHAVSEEKREEYEKEADKYWDKFYGIHQNRFFKDRHWLFTEFPELNGGEKQRKIDSDEVAETEKAMNSLSHEEKKNLDNTYEDSDTYSALPEHEAGAFQSKKVLDSEAENLQGSSHTDKPFKLLEVGCGVGNTVFPILKTNMNPNLMIYCCDFSSTAVDIVKAHPDYDADRCLAFVHDITDEDANIPISPGSLDAIVMIFVLSAVNPDKMQTAINHLASYLKPGGTILFRDYGRYDLAQLRFKEGRCLSENFYVRGDGTRVYFFTQAELKTLFEKAGLVEKENQVDRRLQVNRARQLKMYRVWIQCRYTKPLTE